VKDERFVTNHGMNCSRHNACGTNGGDQLTAHLAFATREKICKEAAEEEAKEKHQEEHAGEKIRVPGKAAGAFAPTLVTVFV